MPESFEKNSEAERPKKIPDAQKCRKIRENSIRKNSRSLNSSKKILQPKILPKKIADAQKYRKIPSEKIVEPEFHVKNFTEKIR